MPSEMPVDPAVLLELVNERRHSLIVSVSSRIEGPADITLHSRPLETFMSAGEGTRHYRSGLLRTEWTQPPPGDP